MSTAMAMPGNTASTYLIHLFGTGLADERFVVQKFRALANGEIRPVAPEAASKGRRAARRVVVSRKQAEAMRPDRTGDHRLHRAHHPRRPAGVGQRRRRPPLRAQAARLNGPSAGRPAGRPKPDHDPGCRPDVLRPRFEFERENPDDLCRSGKTQGARPRAVQEVDRRAGRRRPVPEMRSTPSGTRAVGLRPMRREIQPRVPAPATRGCGPREGRDGTPPGRGPPNASVLAGRPGSGARRVCAFDAEQPRWRTGRKSWEPCLEKQARFGPRELRRRESRGETLRRRQHRGETKERPVQEQAAPETAGRGGALYPLRQAPTRRMGDHLHAVPTEAPDGGAPAVYRAPGRRALYPAAAARSMTASRAAPHAPRSRTPPSVRNGRTPARAGSTGSAAPPTCAQRAGRRPWAGPGVLPARNVPTSGPPTPGSCRSIPRASRCSCAATTSPWPSSTTRWRSRPSSPSRSSAGDQVEIVADAPEIASWAAWQLSAPAEAAGETLVAASAVAPVR